MNTTATIPLEGILTFLDSMTLSIQNKRWLGEQLMAQAMKEEKGRSMCATHTKRVSKVRRRSASSPSDAELDVRFAGLEMPEIPADPEWSQVINSNTGKTIKPIEKWL